MIKSAIRATVEGSLEDAEPLMQRGHRFKRLRKLQDSQPDFLGWFERLHQREDMDVETTSELRKLILQQPDRIAGLCDTRHLLLQSLDRDSIARELLELL